MVETIYFQQNFIQAGTNQHIKTIKHCTETLESEVDDNVASKHETLISWIWPNFTHQFIVDCVADQIG